MIWGENEKKVVGQKICEKSVKNHEKSVYKGNIKIFGKKILQKKGEMGSNLG